MRDELVPKSDSIFGLIEEIYAQGVRRPGCPADRWAVEFSTKNFREGGLENVRKVRIIPHFDQNQLLTRFS